jgi:simple sugar transport system ATP-binding protein
VLRGGHVVGTVEPEESDEHKLAAMMVGREVILSVEKGLAHPTEQVLHIEDLRVLDDRGVPVVNGASFFVRAGEVLGIAGVQGNGQTELVEALTGLRPATGGAVKLLGQDMTSKPPRPIIESGTAHVPEDRHKHGLVLPFPITDNLVLCTYYKSPFARLMQMDYAAIDENARERIRDFDIRTPSEFIPAESLSGGNQQKVIVARELSRPIKLLIVNQPTRGLDVGSIEYIHNRIVERRDQGCAVLLVSAELDEILSLSDRIAVIYKGRIVATLPAAEATREKLGLLMAGVLKEGAQT